MAAAHRSFTRIRQVAPMCTPPKTCLLTSRSFIETVARIELVFGTGTSFHPSYIVVTGNSDFFEKGYFTLELCSKLRFGISILSKLVIDLAPERWTLRA